MPKTVRNNSRAAPRSALLVLALILLAVASCRKDGSAKSSAAVSLPPQAKKEAAEVFKTRCTPCHGAAGKGDGAASASLDPKPRDFSEPSWQQATTDEHIEKIIVYGGAAVGKAPTMPGNPDLSSKKDVVTALRVQIRNFKK